MLEHSDRTILLICEGQQLTPSAGSLYRCSLKELPPERLYKALCAAGDGELWVDDRLRRHFEPAPDAGRCLAAANANPQVGRLSSPAALSEQLADSLSPRDREVLKMIASGATNRQISEKLFLSISTIKLVIRRLLDIMHVADRTQAAVFATKHGLI